jgi:putative polyhydroxyalkanoate system protein
MSDLRVCRELDVDDQECQALAVKLLEKLVSKFGGKYKQEGLNYRYKHSAGVNALVEAKAGELNVDVKLGMMTRALAPQLEKEMNRVLDAHLEDL